MKDYLADPGLSSSLLKKILISPADFKAAQEQKIEEETKQTILGTAIHTYLLEPGRFHNQYAIQAVDYGPRNKGPGRKEWFAFKKANEGKICFSYDECTLFSKLLLAKRAHKELCSLLDRNPIIEKSFFYQDKDYGRLKCRPDILTQDGVIWDLKTTSKEMDDESISKTVYFMTYHFQAAHYIYVMNQLGFDIKGFGWIFVSTEGPATHIVMRLANKELLKAGKTDHQHALELYRECKKTGNWPGFDMNVGYIGLPQFAEKVYS